MLAADFPQRLIPPGYLRWFEPRLLRNGPPVMVLVEWPGVVFWFAACLVVVGVFLTPVAGADVSDSERARKLRTTGTGSAQSWMTTWQGNTYWFSGDGSSYVA